MPFTRRNVFCAVHSIWAKQEALAAWRKGREPNWLPPFRTLGCPAFWFCSTVSQRRCQLAIAMGTLLPMSLSRCGVSITSAKIAVIDPSVPLCSASLSAAFPSVMKMMP